MDLIRLTALVGPASLTRLRRKTVLVCGLGGVGGHACEALARSGLGTLVLADFDVVEPTNLNRQIVALASTVGRAKTDVMRDRIADIDPAVQVRLFPERIAESILPRLLDPRPDFVVDAIDDVPAKVALLAACVRQGIPVVAAMGFANRLHPEDVRLGTLSNATPCPLARAVRKGLREAGVASAIPIVYSVEAPRPPLVPDVRLGSGATVPATAGLFAASYVVNSFLKEDIA